MKLKIIYIVLLLVGMRLLASSKQCAKAGKPAMESTEETKKKQVQENLIANDDDDELSGLSLLPFNMLLFKL